MHQQATTPTVLNQQAGRWLIDTENGRTLGRLNAPIQAAPLLAERQRERSGDCSADFEPFRREMEAILARRREAQAQAQAQAHCGQGDELPMPTAPIDVDLPATFGDKVMVIGVAALGTLILCVVLGRPLVRWIGA